VTTTATGSASGWSCHQYSDGTWFWSAYGPNGGSQGRAASKADAERAAQAQAENLKAPRATDG
jgi:hypothetical protein